MFAPVAPFDQLKEYGGVPPVAVALAMPLETPLQEASELEAVTVTGGAAGA